MADDNSPISDVPDDPLIFATASGFIGYDYSIAVLNRGVTAVSWMRLFYRIFIRPTAKPMAATTAYSVGSDKNSNENNSRGGASGGGGSSGEQNANNSSRNSSSSDPNLNESQGNAEPSASPGKGASNNDDGEIIASIDGCDSTKPKPAVDVVSSDATVNNKTSETLTRTSETANIPPLEATCYKSVESKYDNKLIITKTNKSDKSGSEKKEKETLKLVLVSKKSDRNDAKVVYSKSETKSSKSPKQSSPSASASFSDFKRLRSNDIRYSDYEAASFSLSTASKTEPKGSYGSRGGAVPGDDSRKSEPQSTKKHNKSNNDYNHINDSSGKKLSEDNSRNKASSAGNEANIVAPVQPLNEVKSKHEKSKPSPHRSESNGTVVAITAPNNSNNNNANGRSEKPSELKCYVNLKKQMVMSPFASSVETNRKPEVPKLKIELPSLKTKISIPKSDSERSPKSAHSSSTSSSAATSPTTSSSTSGKSPMWSRPEESVKPADNPQIDIEEYAKTIGLKPVYKTGEGEGKKKKKNSTTSSPDPPSFHRKRKKAKHSKEAGSKRRKLHAEISSQHDESLKMKVKITEKPSKHERKPSEEITPQSPKETVKQNTEVRPSSTLPSMSAPSSASSSLSLTAATIPSPKEDSSKVIDITKGDDDDDVKIIEQPTFCVQPKVTDCGIGKLVVAAEKPMPVATRVNELPKLASLGGTTDSSTKAKINEMRAIRHKPMVYIPNLDKHLSDSSSTINSIIESVQARTGFIDNDNDVQIVSTSKLDTGNSLPSKHSLPSLVASKPATTGLSMKPPTMIPSTVNSRTVSTNNFPRPTQRIGAQGPMFSPRHTPNYPPLALQSVQKKVAVQSSHSTSLYQPRNANPALKRSTSVDSSTTHNIPPKTPRVDLFELNAQNRLLKKPIYAPMFNFVKGASLAKNGNPTMPTSANDVPYKSPISSTYTKEVNTKSSMPSLLLPPSSISVTKMTDSTPKPSPVDNRPALEIVRIPSTAPVADKPQTSATGSAAGLKSNLTSKANRPPPSTIPLIKIKKSASVPEQSSSSISPSIFQVTSSGTKSATKLTTSPASHQDTSGALDLTTRANDDLIILESSDSLTSKLNGNEPKSPKDSTMGRQLPQTKQPDSDGKIDIDSSRLELINSLIQTSAASMIKAGSSVMAKFQSAGIPGLKLPADMIGFAVTTSTNSGSNMPRLGLTYSSASPTATSTVKSISMPKLAEINRNRNIAVRQPNPSVRSIPNPSALAFRNQTDAISSSSSGHVASPTAASFSLATSNNSSTITSLSPASPAKVMNVNMRINNANTAGQKSSVNNNGIDTFASGRTYTNTITTNTASASYNGNMGSNYNNSNSTNNNSSRNDSVSSTSGSNNNYNNNNNATTNGTNGGKKTIEKVAAGLRATAAANATNGNRNSSNATTTTTSTSSTTPVVSGGKNGVNVV
ncbi:uncharacterized protein DDB_G0284459-like [Wyeomyia smithii]|uniref:uncharacterized protein DDB_G0284459-like n=1 Tax=Wyeomyia smithii TaxID=174621 RepID=UPI002467F577|nr:uncharacterized protein DDB_G0284459-like [Wyeomyia smithii]